MEAPSRRLFPAALIAIAFLMACAPSARAAARTPAAPSAEQAAKPAERRTESTLAAPSQASETVHGAVEDATKAAHGAAAEVSRGDAAAHGEAAPSQGEAAAHGEGERHGGGVPEIPNAIQLLYEYFHEAAIHEGADPNAGVAGFFKTLHKGPIKEPLPIVGTIPWENHVFSIGAAVFLVFLFWLGVRKLNVRAPSRWQALIESIVEGFDNFILGILGPKHGRAFAPYIMTLFLFILVNNLMVLVPFLKSSTSSLVLTGSLALLTFVIVQATALISLGPWKYFYHLMGEPKGGTWFLAPLFLFLHVIGELARPVSLALRLFGNILGEDILLGAFLVMGVGLAAFVGIPAPAPGIPLHFPFMFLVILTSTIQALVFSLLTAIYILLVLPHDEHHGEEHGEAEASHSSEHGAGHVARGEASPA